MRLIAWLVAISTVFADQEDFWEDGENLVSKVDKTKYTVGKTRKYLLYEVNSGEGFNLRRDVYMRIANAVRLLRKDGHNYVLVLPPWGRLHHWERLEFGLQWRLFFDVKSLNRFVPVIEFDEFLEETDNIPIKNVVYLQNFAEGWGTEYVRKCEERPCLPPAEQMYRKDRDGKLWKGWFFSYDDVRAENFKCVSFQGDSATLKDMIISNYSDGQSIMIDRGETVLHESYGEKNYWRARRSMRYSQELVDAVDYFRDEFLDSNDEDDNTELNPNWMNHVIRRLAIGGPFIGVHWRRRDFLYARKAELPTIEGTAKILNKLAKKLNLTKIYLATDAPVDEVQQLESFLDNGLKIYRFLDSKTFNDGQIAIIDQFICAHARYFIGSHESTFSFRIQEDREILGFPVETTFNRLCPDDKLDCEQPTKWLIKY